MAKKKSKQQAPQTPATPQAGADKTSASAPLKPREGNPITKKIQVADNLVLGVMSYSLGKVHSDESLDAAMTECCEYLRKGNEIAMLRGADVEDSAAGIIRGIIEAKMRSPAAASIGYEYYPKSNTLILWNTAIIDKVQTLHSMSPFESTAEFNLAGKTIHCRNFALYERLKDARSTLLAPEPNGIKIVARDGKLETSGTVVESGADEEKGREEKDDDDGASSVKKTAKLTSQDDDGGVAQILEDPYRQIITVSGKDIAVATVNAKGWVEADYKKMSDQIKSEDDIIITKDINGQSHTLEYLKSFAHKAHYNRINIEGKFGLIYRKTISLKKQSVIGLGDEAILKLEMEVNNQDLVLLTPLVQLHGEITPNALKIKNDQAAVMVGDFRGHQGFNPIVSGANAPECAIKGLVADDRSGAKGGNDDGKASDAADDQPNVKTVNLPGVDYVIRDMTIQGHGKVSTYTINDLSAIKDFTEIGDQCLQDLKSGVSIILLEGFKQKKYKALSTQIRSKYPTIGSIKIERENGVVVIWDSNKVAPGTSVSDVRKLVDRLGASNQHSTNSKQKDSDGEGKSDPSKKPSTAHLQPLFGSGSSSGQASSLTSGTPGNADASTLQFSDSNSHGSATQPTTNTKQEGDTKSTPRGTGRGRVFRPRIANKPVNGFFMGTGQASLLISETMLIWPSVKYLGAEVIVPLVNYINTTDNAISYLKPVIKAGNGAYEALPTISNAALAGIYTATTFYPYAIIKAHYNTMRLDWSIPLAQSTSFAANIYVMHELNSAIGEEVEKAGLKGTKEGVLLHCGLVSLMSGSAAYVPSSIQRFNYRWPNIARINTIASATTGGVHCIASYKPEAENKDFYSASIPYVVDFLVVVGTLGTTQFRVRPNDLPDRVDAFKKFTALVSMVAFSHSVTESLIKVTGGSTATTDTNVSQDTNKAELSSTLTSWMSEHPYQAATAVLGVIGGAIAACTGKTKVLYIALIPAVMSAVDYGYGATKLVEVGRGSDSLDTDHQTQQQPLSGSLPDEVGI